MRVYAWFAVLECAFFAAEAQLRCGEAGPNPRRQPRVTGSASRPAAPGRYPWMAMIGLHRGNDIVQWVCGGALITRLHVLTAAHCLEDVTLSQLHIRLGENDIRGTGDGQHQDLRPARFAIHPQMENRYHDIALITLEAEPVQGPLVRPICLPASGTAAVRLDGLRAAVAGWGDQQGVEGGSPVLREAEVEIFNTDACEINYKAQVPAKTIWYPYGFQNTVVCATDPRLLRSPFADPHGNYADSCKGDSGGPLMVSAVDGRFYVLGVVATGIGCGTPDALSLYTKVSSHLPWIKEEIGRDDKEGSTSMLDGIFLEPIAGGRTRTSIPP